ncbi:hypothetical protein BDR26DRAFT_390325 [Obelidium mucronatum]|nr:hypothetical protein BDR26DRAFT_390325 [Obelidium mucronatum]
MRIFSFAPELVEVFGGIVKASFSFLRIVVLLELAASDPGRVAALRYSKGISSCIFVFVILTTGLYFSEKKAKKVSLFYSLMCANFFSRIFLTTSSSCGKVNPHLAE